MIAAGFPVEIRDQSAAAPTTGLHIAAREGAWLNVRLLLEAGVDANSGGNDAEEAEADEAEAAEAEAAEAAEAADEFFSGEQNAENNLEMIRARETRASPPPSPPPHVPDTPLSLAAGHGHHHCASELVLYGCAIDMPVRKHKVTVRCRVRYLPPLLYARHHPCSVVTVSHPARPFSFSIPLHFVLLIPLPSLSSTSSVLPPRTHLLNPTPMRGVQALWLAAQSGHLRTVKTLLSLGASPLKKSTEGVSPFFVGEPKNISARPNAYILLVHPLTHPGRLWWSCYVCVYV